MALLTGRRGLRSGIVMTVGFVLCAAPARPQPRENDVKAAFLYNFAKYIDWPADAFRDGAAAFEICVLAGPAFVTQIDSLIAGETLDGRPVVRRVPEDVEAARSCHILYVDRSALSRLQPLVTALRGTSVLKVSDAPDFLDRGGTIAFIREGTRIRFDVNVAEAQRGGLSISSRLLRIARRISTT